MLKLTVEQAVKKYGIDPTEIGYNPVCWNEFNKIQKVYPEYWDVLFENDDTVLVITVDDIDLDESLEFLREDKSANRIKYTYYVFSPLKGSN